MILTVNLLGVLSGGKYRLLTELQAGVSFAAEEGASAPRDCLAAMSFWRNPEPG